MICTCVHIARMTNLLSTGGGGGGGGYVYALLHIFYALNDQVLRSVLLCDFGTCSTWPGYQVSLG